MIRLARRRVSTRNGDLCYHAAPMGSMTAPFLLYVFVTTFTPGPNNVTSAAAGARSGYPAALSYILGIFTGFAFIMFACGLLTSTMTRLLPRIQPILKILGALYMLWLAVEIIRSTWTTQEEEQAGTAFAFGRGLLLQLVNVKVIIYGLTIFSGFLLEVRGGAGPILVASVALASVSFASTSVWAVFGSLIGGLLENRRLRLLFNLLMALLLLYSAVSVAGITDLLAA